MRFLYFVLAASLITCSSNVWSYRGTVTIETHMEYPKEDREDGWLRKRCKVIDNSCTQEYDGKLFYQPRYPASMLGIGMRAICVADVKLDKTGKISSVREIVCNPDERDFKKSIEKVIRRFDFYPRIVNGVPQEVDNVLLKFNYSIVP